MNQAVRKPTGKQITGKIGLLIMAGAATPSPPVGPALAQKKLNIKMFCDQFNERTKGVEGPVPVEITAYADGSFTFITKCAPVSYMLRKAIGKDGGAKKPGFETVGTVTKEQVRAIAEKKMQDMSILSVEAAMSMVEGTARSMGINIGN